MWRQERLLILIKQMSDPFIHPLFSFLAVMELASQGRNVFWRVILDGVKKRKWDSLCLTVKHGRWMWKHPISVCCCRVILFMSPVSFLLENRTRFWTEKVLLSKKERTKETGRNTATSFRWKGWPTCWKWTHLNSLFCYLYMSKKANMKLYGFLFFSPKSLKRRLDELWVDWR